MAGKKIKVLHVIKGLGRGGAERLLISTIRLHSKEYEFDVVYYFPQKSHLVPDLQALGCNVLILPANNVLAMLMKLPQLIRHIHKNQYHILHAHLPWAGIVARIAGKITTIPVIYTEHNLFNRYNIVTRIACKLTFKWQSQVIAVSDRVADVLLNLVHPSVPVRIIRNGVDVSEFQKVIDNGSSVINNGQFHKGSWEIPEGAVVIGTVTALTPQKRIDRWISIAEGVSRRMPEAYFVIVGDGVLRNELYTKGSKLVKEKKLLFAGITSEPKQWLNCFDIFLMSSDFEGLPVALLEAMSMECVPVVPAVGGIPTVVKQDVSGYLYEPENEKDAVDKILLLSRSSAMRKEMGRVARSVVVGNFSVVRMVNELEELYCEVIKVSG